MLESNWQTQTTMYIAKQKENPTTKEFVKDPKAKMEFDKMHQVYARIYALAHIAGNRTKIEKNRLITCKVINKF